MQFDLPFQTAADFRLPEETRSAGVPRPVGEAHGFRRAVEHDSEAIEFVRVRAARKYILRVRPDGSLRVTIPRGGSGAQATQFVARQRAWIARERARVRRERAPVRWGAGSTVLLGGDPHTIRIVEIGGRLVAGYADRLVNVGSGEDVRPEIERDLRVLAQERLIPRVRELAAQHGLNVRKVTIRNQRSRWGSCSRSGAIALNFRLVQMPAAMSDYVLIHELMHLKQQNHGPRFWSLVERACPEFVAAERWLRESGRGLF